MTDLPAKPDPPNGPDAASMVAELEALLARQVQLTRADDLDGASALNNCVGILLGRLLAISRTALAPHTGRIGRIRTLRRTLGLMLAQRKCEHTDAKAQLTRGKNLARAYARHTRPGT